MGIYTRNDFGYQKIGDSSVIGINYYYAEASFGRETVAEL
jgi:hypothetical protein